MLAVLCTSASAFVAPSLAPRGAALAAAPVTPAYATLPSALRRCEPEPAMVLSLPKLALAVPTMYALMSINEYATHRWYQHEEFNRDHWLQRLCQRMAHVIRGRPLLLSDGRKNMIKIKGGGHVEHHAETYDDMSLKKDPRWRRTKAAASLDADEFRGTAFTWGVTLLMTIQMLPTTLPVFAMLGFSLFETFKVLLPGMIVHAAVWNGLHPPMHGLPPVPISVGVPTSWGSWLLHTPFFKYINENHQGHHVLGGQCNYNVCCPLTDHLLGTYVPVSVWSQKMRAVPGPDATERWGEPVMPRGVPVAPVLAKGTASQTDLTPTALLNAPA